jgi:hypothetical protein
VAPYGLEKWSPGLFLKASVALAEPLAFYVRPCFLCENRAFSLRAAATLDLLPCRGRRGKTDDPRGGAEKRPVDMRPYIGGGLAWYKRGSYVVNPMVSGGLDVGLFKRFVLMGGGNLLLEQGDTDLELLAGFGIRLR